MALSQVQHSLDVEYVWVRRRKVDSLVQRLLGFIQLALTQRLRGFGERFLGIRCQDWLPGHARAFVGRQFAL